MVTKHLQVLQESGDTKRILPVNEPQTNEKPLCVSLRGSKRKFPERAEALEK